MVDPAPIRERFSRLSPHLNERGRRLRWLRRKPAVTAGTKERRKAEVFLSQFAVGRGTPESPEAPTVDQILAGYPEDRKPVVRAFDTLEVAAKNLRPAAGLSDQ